MDNHIPVPVQQWKEMEKICVCSACGVKVQFVFDQDDGHLVGLACDGCNTFWPLILPKEE